MIITKYGGMGAGKTGTLITDKEKIENDVYHKGRILVFSPKIDVRFGVGKIKERDHITEEGIVIPNTGREIESIPIESIFEMDEYLASQKTKYKRYRDIFIDEMNFFESEPNEEKGIDLKELELRRNESIKIILERSLKDKVDFHLYGLNLTAEMHPYGLMAVAIAFTKPKNQYELFAECADCLRKARYTYYIPYEKGTNVFGANDYCAMCGTCHFKWRDEFLEAKKQNKLDEYFMRATALKPDLEAKLEDPNLIEELPKWYVKAMTQIKGMNKDKKLTFQKDLTKWYLN